MLLLITYFLNAIICIAYKIVNSIYLCCNSSKVSRTVFKKWFDGEICIQYDCMEIRTMFIKDLKTCKEFIAGDNAILRELLHPDKAELKLRYSLAHAMLKPGHSSYRHKLKTSEIYYILEGEGLMHIDNESARVLPGQVIYIPPDSVQYIKNTGKGDLKFLCIVDPAWRKEDEVIL